MNNVCPNCGITGPNFSCPDHTYCWGTGNTQSPIKLMPNMDEEKRWLFAETGRLGFALNKANKEIERLKGLMPPDERGPGFVGQGSWSVFAEKVVAERDFLRNQIDEYIALIEDLRKKGIIDQHNRPLPLEGHHKDCGHGKDGWSMCTCDELKKVDEERANRRFKCSKCGDTGLVAYGPNFRGMKQCDCVKGRPSQLAESVTKAFQSAAAGAVRTTLDRGGTAVGEVQGQWQVVSKTCEHGNTECKRCGVGQPTRDSRQDLKMGEHVRFEIEGIITARQSAGIVKDYDGNDFELVLYVIRELISDNNICIPYNKILNVIGKEK